ncbi:MAG: hypothetical protein JRH03_13470 [Deltaproteobacteria bacterium]|nr:hypothetical protein [Deltaproteobacteria bacterium]
MNSSNQTDNETICKNIFAEFRGRLTWKWDDWVGTILTEFDAEKEDDIRAVLEKFLPISWDSANINTAPQIVQKLDKHLGGIRHGGPGAMGRLSRSGLRLLAKIYPRQKTIN